MSNFPYIKWWQNNKQVFIQFLHKSENTLAEKKDNILVFKDNIYNIELDLFNNFSIDNILTNPKNIKLILNKIDEVKWTKLLKNEKKYKYYISTDWDKFLEDELEENTNMDMNNMMQGFDPSMFNSDQLKDLMSNMNNNDNPDDLDNNNDPDDFDNHNNSEDLDNSEKQNILNNQEEELYQEHTENSISNLDN